LDEVRRLAAAALCPAHFFLTEPLAVELVHEPAEEVFWEIYRGRLLDRPQTMRRQSFEAWNLFLIEEAGRSAEPLLSLKLDAAAEQLHVTRAIYSYAWEGYDGGGNVILSRETKKWVRELVGTIPLARFPNALDLEDEIICRVFQAVVGTSRLPLTSVEAPLPGFSLGQLAYFHRPGLDAVGATAGPLRSYFELVDKALTDELSWGEKAKLLETLLHATPYPELAEAADRFMARWRNVGASCQLARLDGQVDNLPPQDPRPDFTALLHTLFNEASLSPYTDLADKALAFLEVLERKRHLTPVEVADFLSRLLRQLGRHLTAYDLVTFHHRGANYPDALLLDAALKAYLKLVERRPALFEQEPADVEPERQGKRIRRRALRQGWLLRRRYEGHLVPDAPTSSGESTRVLPAPHVRVPEEQILYQHRRTRRLFEGDPLDRHLGDRAQAVLRQSMEDLKHPSELRELGMAVFLNRPLSGGKHALEPDQTLLLSYLAFSRAIARQRLQYLAEDLRLIPNREEYALYGRLLENNLEVKGIPVAELPGSAQPGRVSLADARRAAEDFLILRTTSSSAEAFFQQYLFGPLLQRFRLEDWSGNAPVLIVRTGGSGDHGEILAIYDSLVRRRVELEFDANLGYESRGGIEYPVNPLRVLRVWEATDDPDQLRERDLMAEAILLPPTDSFLG
jgi:hypothetical protein